MKQRGFTITEIVIVLTVMGILLILGAVNLSSSQASGRDAERKIDIETLAINLENYYTSGSSNTIDGATLGEYPPISITSSSSSMSQYLDSLDKNSIMAPGITNPTDTFKAATNNIQTTDGVRFGSDQQPTKDTYIYQPLTSNGLLCDSEADMECRKYNLYYRLEVANITNECPPPGFICKFTSKNQ